MRSSVRSLILGSLCLVSLLVASQAAAKPAHKKPAAAEPAAAEAPAADEPAGAEPAAPETETQKQFKAIQWTHGPSKVNIAGHADLQIPEGFSYTGSSGAQKLLELMHNPTSGTELGILTDKELEMFVLFEFDDIGYVKDADKEKLDADDILKSIKEGNENANEARKEKGWPPDHHHRLAHGAVLQPRDEQPRVVHPGREPGAHDRELQHAHPRPAGRDEREPDGRPATS